MAERIVSPGVFTRERDLSFLTQGIGDIGGAFIGPTPKGPAFIPTIVRSQFEYVTQFGEADANHYMGLTVKNYLREAGVATIVRVLGLEGYDGADHESVLLYATASGVQKLLAVLHPISGGAITDVQSAGDTGSFSLVISNSVGLNISQSGLSAIDGQSSYFGDFFGTSPATPTVTDSAGNVVQQPSYIYAIFPDALDEAGVTDIIAVTSSAALPFSGSQYSNASTAWIQSQTIGATKYDLFKLHTLSDGNSSNKEIKISILDMKPSDDTDYEYGTFSLLVRRFRDTDTRPEILEQYNNINLDPDSPQFIARVIGNSVPTEDANTGEVFYQGDFQNLSSYIYVEMAEGGAPDAALPYGFGAYSSVAVVDGAFTVSPNFINTRWLSGSVEGYTTSAIDKKHYYGWDFRTYDGTNDSYLGPVPTGAPTINTAFNLENVIDVPSGSNGGSASVSLTNADGIDTLTYRKFSVPFQGGFDGRNPSVVSKLGEEIVATNTQGFDLSTSTSDGSTAYKKALTALSNADQFDFNLLVIPGVIYQLHSYIATEAIDLCEERGDCFYIMDSTVLTATTATAVSKAAELDTNYAATYYPWLRVIDQNTNKLLWVPPSVVLPEIYAYSDNVSAEWFAPAGLNRGGIPSAVGVRFRLAQATRDTLYEGKVNPIAQFPGQGICIWGQKTLQRRPSALDRVNVRRLLIAVKKFIASSSRYLVFEQNVESTRNRFLNIVNPYLASVQERSGLYAFRVVMDETNNTPDVIDRNILFGQLYLQPTKTAEFIVLDFNVLPTGATFPDA